MCTSGDEEEGGTSTSTAGGYSGGEVPEIVVTAPRLSLDQETVAQIDWSDVGILTLIGASSGLYNGGGIPGAIVGGLAAGAGTIETQEGVDLADLVTIENDMIVVPGVPGPYIPLY